MGKIIIAVLFVTIIILGSCVKREVPYLPGMGSAPTPVATITE